jgi:hypothetical protein
MSSLLQVDIVLVGKCCTDYGCCNYTYYSDSSIKIRDSKSSTLVSNNSTLFNKDDIAKTKALFISSCVEFMGKSNNVIASVWITQAEFLVSPLQGSVGNKLGITIPLLQLFIVL